MTNKNDKNDKNKKLNDSFQQNSKKGASDSALAFIKEGSSFLDEEDLELEEGELSEEDLEDPEFLSFDEDLEQELDDIEVVEEKKDDKKPVTGIVSKKIVVKKETQGQVAINKEASRLVNELVKGDISENEVNSFLNLSPQHKELLFSGELELSLRGKLSASEKKELASKLDDIKASDDISKANASFVLKWLKNRK